MNTTNLTSKANYIPASAFNKNVTTQNNIFKQFESNIELPTRTTNYNPEIDFEYEKKKKMFIASAVATVIGGLVFAVSLKKYPGSFNKAKNYFQEMSENLAIEINHASIEKNPNLDWLKFKLKVHRSMETFFERTYNILGNLDHGKNTFLKKLSEKCPPLNNGISYLNAKFKPFYANTVKESSKQKYTETNKNFKELKKTLLSLNKENKEITGLLDEVEKKLSRLEKEFDCPNGRLNNISSCVSETISDYYKKIQNLNKDVFYKEHMSLHPLENKLKQAHNHLNRSKSEISFGFEDYQDILKNLLNEIKSNEKYTPSSDNLLPKIRKEIYNLSKTKDTNKTKEFIRSLPNNSEIQESIETAKAAIESKAGLLEEIFNHKDLKIDENALEQLKKLKNQLNKATEFEKVNLPGRLLDLEIGHTPFIDTTALIMPVAILTQQTIGQSESKEEVISNTIQTVPTIIGGLGGTLYSLKKGIFGPSALMFGLTTGYVFNKGGEMLDNIFYGKGKLVQEEKIRQNKMNTGVFNNFTI